MSASSALDVDASSNIEEEARRAARKRAIERLAEELQHPEQLSKVCVYRFLLDSHLHIAYDDSKADFFSSKRSLPRFSRLGRANQVQALQQEDLSRNTTEEPGELAIEGGQ